MQRRHRLKQLGLFGPVNDAAPSAPGGLVLAEYDGRAVRMFVVDGEPWWILSDVAKLLGYRDARDASRLLRDKHKGTRLVRTPSGDQEMLTINEPGLYRLMMRSDRPEAEAFQDWVTDEVLPAIRKTGRYQSKGGRLARLARQAKTKDPHTLSARAELAEVNKRVNRRLAASGAKPHQFRRYHDASYRAQFGRPASEIRKALGVPSHVSPLDRMGSLPLSHGFQAKLEAERIIADRALELGRPLSADEQDEVLSGCVQQIRDESFSRLGFGYRYGLVEERGRGTVLDVVKSLPASN